jgi:hypothetical protein
VRAQYSLQAVASARAQWFRPRFDSECDLDCGSERDSESARHGPGPKHVTEVWRVWQARRHRPGPPPARQAGERRAHRWWVQGGTRCRAGKAQGRQGLHLALPGAGQARPCLVQGRQGRQGRAPGPGRGPAGRTPPAPTQARTRVPAGGVGGDKGRRRRQMRAHEAPPKSGAQGAPVLLVL